MKKKNLLFLAVSIAIAALFFPIFLPQKDPSSQHLDRLNALTDRFFCEELTSSTLNLHYTLADPAAYGIHAYPVRYGFLSKENLQQSSLLIENYQASLKDIDKSVLPPDAEFTCDVLEYTLDMASEGLNWYYYDEPLSPTLGIQAQLPILLAEYAFYIEQDVVDYLTLLEQTDDYFQSILQFEQEKARKGLFMSADTLDAIVNQCIDFLNLSDEPYLELLFQEKLDALSDLSTAKKAQYQDRHAEVLAASFYPAYEQLVNGLMALRDDAIPSSGLCNLPNGTSYYSYLVRASVGTDRTPESIQTLLEEKRVEYTAAIRHLLSRNPSLLTKLDSSMTAQTPEQILQQLRQQIRKDFPPLPATSVTVKEVHPSLQEYSSPAFYLTPPIDRITENTIYINPSNSCSSLELFTTLAHEGYPGHLYQTVYSHTNCPNPLQSILNIGGYTEGWATYAEIYAYSLTQLAPDEAELLRLSKCWTLNLYCTIDLGIHYYGWTAYDVYEFLHAYGINNLEASKEIFQAVLEDPANYLKYYIGYLEFEALRKKAEDTLGSNFSPIDFHQALLRLGPAPFFLLEDAMDAYIARKD